MRTAFELARDKAGITDLTPHDFRHTCITRWTIAGMPREVVMAASGHSSFEMHDRYVNVKDHHLTESFAKMQTECRHETAVDSAEAVSR